MDPAEKDDLGFRLLGRVGQPEGVAEIIGHPLDGLDLVIVGQDNGVALLLQGQDFLLQRGERLLPGFRGKDLRFKIE